MPTPYDEVKDKTAEEILANFHAADSNSSSYLQTAARIRSNQELIRALEQASKDSGMVGRRVVWLTAALIFVGILQAIATGWGYLAWWLTHHFRFGV